MSSTMEWNSFFSVLLSLSWVFFIKGSCQLQSSQTQVLLQLKKHLEYPKPLEMWYNKTIDFCYLSSPQVNITCQDNFVTEIRVFGDKPRNKVTIIDGFSSFPNNQTLSESFSMDSFVATLSRLSSLRVLVMVSLGMWGPLPDKIHRLYSLEHLDLSSNFLFGSVPPQISRLVKLQDLALNLNFLNGTLSDLSSLTGLQSLDLSDNKIDSGLPLLPKSLVTAILGNNSFSGEIPRRYSQLVHLQHLDLSFNSLTGSPLPTLFSLPNMSYLNLASNKLSGSLPVHLNCGSRLEFVDISNNRIRGSLPSCLSSAKYSWNCLLIDSGNEQNPESYCNINGTEVTKGKSRGKKDVGILVGVVGGLSVVVVLMAIGCVVACRKYCPRETSEKHLLHSSVKDNTSLKGGFTSDVLTNARYISQAAKLVTEGFPMCRVFSYEELMEATNKFDKSSLMGEGSYGKLYKGRLENGSQVAIRCLTVSKQYTIRNLKLRLDLLGRLRHPYLVCLLGHCIDSGGRVDASLNQVYLVYEYIPNGNYSTHLSDNSKENGLKWSDRLAALIGVAKAVHFLHTGIIPGFFNNRLKASNILLNEHRIAKLSDYGLSIIAEETNKAEVDGDGDDLKSRQMESLEDDVYSFGFILLESLVGRSAPPGRDQVLLNEMESFDSQDGRRQIVDPFVLASCSKVSLSVIVSLTNKCISPDSSVRPSFEDVLWNLQYAAQVQAAADGGDH